jgi:2,4-dienoyl-CoA reductase-like NADH-dependent reductase (Old Yellow Enzyme family)/thioredoxin reductase
MATLFEPISIGGLRLKNRIAMAPMATLYANEDGSVSDRLQNYIVARAKGGVGLIILEGAYTHSTGKGFPNQLSIDHDHYIPALKNLTSAVHQEGAKIALQLLHTGRQNPLTSVQTPVAPSPIPCPVLKKTPRALTAVEIKEITDSFAEGAFRAVKAGFDCIDIHAAHGYLINQFLSPYSNRRTDEYGRDLHGRARFILEIIEKTKANVGPGFPISCRISADEFVTGGLDIEQSKQIARLLQRAGICAIHVSAGVYESAQMIIPPFGFAHGTLAYLAKDIKDVVDVPVSAVGRIIEPQTAEEIISRGDADMIALGRALIADPDWPIKAMENRFEEIRQCIGCGACRQRAIRPQINCLLNYEAGREEEAKIITTEKPKKVWVIGGGPAGLEAARVAALEGHRVTLYEKREKLGGTFLLASLPPRKSEYTKAIEYLTRQLKRLKVSIHLNREVREDLIFGSDAEAFIFATGASPSVPDVPGIDQPNVVHATAILSEEADAGHSVLVVGGGLVGAETAEFLAAKGKKVTLIEMLDGVALDAPDTVRIVLLENLRKKRVDMKTSTTLKAIAGRKVLVITNNREEPIDGIDTVVLAVGSKPNSELFEKIKAEKAEVFIIGDSLKPRTALEAIHEGSKIARTF